ncbi:MAG TPA: CBASS cGAMP-activated phospholipase [Burkholderiaceae bacterium]|nr:CBASS cGAMP-activated phospholipase [Burkholderiaceae bacterium]
MTPPSKRHEYRILSLSGGGYLGLYSACVLTELEARVGEPLGRRFDLLAGTSVGGILAIALAFEIPMAAIKRVFLERGRRIFSIRSLPSGPITRALDFARLVTGPKYSGEALRDALAEYLGDQTLGQALHNLVVPAVNVSLCRSKVFKTPHVRGSTGDESIPAADVAMATCAAPAYFPSVKIGESLYADGGLFAVSPDQVALHEAEHFIGIDPATVRMLSIGTATTGYLPNEAIHGEVGAVAWIAEGRLILTLISVQQQHIQTMMEDRLGQRYLRLDARWPDNAGLGLDVATVDATATLMRLANQTVRATPAETLNRFLGK